MSAAQTAFTALTVSLALGLTVSVSLLVIHLIGFAKFGVWTNDAFHIRKMLFVCTVMILLELSILCAMMFAPWSGNPEGCYLLPSFVALAFIMLKQAQIIFLYARAKVVHNALRLNSKMLIYFRWLVFLGATAGVTFVFYALQFVFLHGHLNEETGFCYLYTTSPAEIVVFACMDFALSFAMIALFVIPLHAHTNKMSQQGEIQVDSSERQKDIWATALRNLVLSSTSIGLSLTALVAFATILALTPVGVEETEYFFIWAIAAPITESYVSLLLIHNLTKFWIPFKGCGGTQSTHHLPSDTGTKLQSGNASQIVVSPASPPPSKTRL